MDLFRVAALERQLCELLGAPVDLVPEPIEKRPLQVTIDRERRRAFQT
ncbi:MAG: hypothetical protein JO015_09295 [Verrucomicrobia bacterium]|nr:hypothetical protein [Verrucomicrobiota bacterium]